MLKLPHTPFCLLILQFMQIAASIVDSVSERPDMHGHLVMESTRQIPGSLRYSIKRFVKPGDWMREDTGMLKYHYESSLPQKNHLELRFCVSGQV